MGAGREIINNIKYALRVKTLGPCPTVLIAKMTYLAALAN